jgi:hypothetical protein
VEIVLETNELDCTIYADQSVGELASHLEKMMLGSCSISWGPGSATCLNASGEIEIRRNSDSNPARASDFPDGFLFFRARLEFYFFPTISLNNRKDLVGKILEALWAEKIPAVAASDYEDELPAGGGNKSPVVPWATGKKLTATPKS